MSFIFFLGEKSISLTMFIFFFFKCHVITLTYLMVGVGVVPWSLNQLLIKVGWRRCFQVILLYTSNNIKMKYRLF